MAFAPGLSIYHTFPQRDETCVPHAISIQALTGGATSSHINAGAPDLQVVIDSSTVVFMRVLLLLFGAHVFFKGHQLPCQPHSHCQMAIMLAPESIDDQCQYGIFDVDKFLSFQN